MPRPKHEETQRVVDREEFMRDPGAVVARATADGPVAITEDDEPILHICVPTDVRADRIV
jgi:hypothetical protein